MPSGSSIFSMYSGVNSATHHIFFPPRLQLVALEQNPDCFAAHLGHQLELDGFFHNQTHRPTGPPFRCLTANPGLVVLTGPRRRARLRDLFRISLRTCSTAGPSLRWSI